MKILIYGSGFLAQKCIEAIDKERCFEIVGQIPNKNIPTVQGIVKYPNWKPYHDIKVSIQYDALIEDIENSFNLHTGILPEWGGMDILYHTLDQNKKEQGLTFHKMTEEFDKGSIISKVTYPVLPTDKVLDLYKRLIKVGPSFLISSLNTLKDIGLSNVNLIPESTPYLYYKGKVKEKDKEHYKKTPEVLNEYARLQNNNNML
jgi:methionyl-tRNA formyltransferase